MAARNLNPIHSVAVACKAGAKPLKLPFWASTTTRASFRKNDISLHAGFGLSVDGKVTTSFTRKCCCCSSPFCREINANFNVWVLPSGRHNGTTQLPEIGGDDQVIYVKPGYEADLDSLVQDTVRLATSVKETCSDSCEKSQPRMQYLGEQKAASIDGRWSRLLELRNAC
ncbi:large ribosomal RNA subunit accumulation protein YCED homolog 2, chloroplastic isoform X3 [Diospyros lotus]|uniref:large ribosomal RNA subunit accumulation protein YCED homolog 2, chloroplastic isoform X3 n=1 Tax=Diospyros lotus TaxID=55363 RepID=UPI002251A0BC|nr:large ribosomal RNA subunit accumulation protein YCED homolog 2, chloroplastic isoform X3 [Diospyros lotus]